MLTSTGAGEVLHHASKDVVRAFVFRGWVVAAGMPYVGGDPGYGWIPTVSSLWCQVMLFTITRPCLCFHVKGRGSCLEGGCRMNTCMCWVGGREN